MQKIIAANWKMYKTRAAAERTALDFAQALAGDDVLSDRQLLVFPSYTNISTVAAVLGKYSHVAVGAQNFYPAKEGAFTGEVSADMLRDAGASWVLTGHSERRHLLGEDDDSVARKTAFALTQGLNVMLCVGETLSERAAGELTDVLSRQIASAFVDLSRDTLFGRLAIVYEPVWAIGTGNVAGQVEIFEAHAATRSLVMRMVGEKGRDIPILYGGSVRPDNAATLVRLDNVDGLLVGGASLEAQSFMQIVKA
ncbi:triose-phosphate isomerase [Candidatus Desulfovibrio trichonymphae]|uniref:Triosephosphate isomerase n=1 Tax=Candidatus Desulfovibrio trichonymphae TaxID=1725232 RepID=A0A1J1DXG6_9BACT|nr:triose-phosphate isomerase [Candidatus Desulfovibrio trichonymphae]BAV91782.1 triose-phosphate isomerase [Candidatus Desulfovibrio trichonymphae]GHU92488.1 triosephosphate isomerase [Deltaproteobacteria bacterium]GHU93852.1 triosephosphate isomerase [Deltaproteobacteria bacterium]GHV00055.1 triosephosphate isomerase [Deltaproteobacteria bacterium]